MRGNLKLFELKSGRGEKLMKNILIISSSPRKKGNSQILCEQFKKGAEAKRTPGENRTYHGAEHRLLQGL